MKLMIRYFAIGILTAALTFAIAFYFFDESSARLEDESVETVINFVEDEGYRVLTEEDYIALSVNHKEKDKDDESKENEDRDQSENKTDSLEENDSEENDDTDEDENENKEDEDEDTTKTYTLHVEENMLAPEVGELLVENGIVDDGEEFARYLEVEGFSPYIQLGDHDVSSDMSFNELANIITNNN